MSRLGKCTIYLAASFLLPAAALSLKTIGLKRTCHLFHVPLIRGKNTEQLPAPQKKEAEQLFLIVHRVARKIPITLQCLPRSIVVCFLLYQARIDSVLRISVKHNIKSLDAHAWVECSNTVLGETHPERQGLQAFS